MRTSHPIRVTACLGLMLSIAGCDKLFSLHPVAHDAPRSIDVHSFDARSDGNLVFITDRGYSIAEVRSRGSDNMLAGADAICAEAAVAGDLPGQYVALLSDATTNAIDRLAGSRGWYRLDGLPFADSPSTLFGDGQVFYPVLYNQFGVQDTTVLVMTGTGDDGNANRTCGNWMDVAAAERMDVGSSTAGSRGWSTRYIPTCDQDDLRLYCFGVGRNAAVVFEPVVGRRAFVSRPFTPSSGIASADLHCQQDADARSLGGTFQALLATSTSAPSARFSTTGPTWVRLDGVALADNAAAMMTGQVIASLTLQSDGVTHYEFLVWTGSGGVSSLGDTTTTCDDWSSALSTAAAYQSAGSTGPNTFFTEMYPGACDTPRPLFCLET